MSKRTTKALSIDHKSKRIIMSCGFAKRQSDTDSVEFEKLQAIHHEFPTYKIVTKSIKKKENKEAYKGLTYSYMEQYISVLGTKEDWSEYENMRFLSECHSVRYPMIKKWFLTKYPEISKYGVIDPLQAKPQRTA